jgi:cell wall-associated NlpC family hydrolase
VPTVCSKGDIRKRQGRATIRAAAGCGLLTLLLLPAAPLPSTAAAHWRLAGDPGPPSSAEVGAAAGQVSQRQAALGAERKRLSAANAQLNALQTQAEVLTERYDQTLVDEQRALAAYRITQARLADARAAQNASQWRVAGLAAEEFESGGGTGSVTAMLGSSLGPDAYLNGAGLGQMLAQYRTGTLAESQASKVVAGVFQAQAHDLYVAQQADLRAARFLKLAVQAAVARQLAFVRSAKAAANRAAGALAAAQAHQAALQAARQAALAAAASQQAAAASQQAAAAGGPSGSVQPPSWARSSGASSSQGDTAASWALSQLGRPYLWGGTGPEAYDCSGLTMMAWAHAGVQLLHWTGYQWIEGPHVPLDQLERGDLVFYATNTSDPGTIHHVGLYIGNGMMVDAPYTGAFVRIDSIYDPGLIGAVRPAG